MFTMCTRLHACNLYRLLSRYTGCNFETAYVVGTLQNFIYKHTIDLENVQRNKKKDKGEVTRRSSKLKLDDMYTQSCISFGPHAWKDRVHLPHMG
jgi:hypothetical protein